MDRGLSSLQITPGSRLDSKKRLNRPFFGSEYPMAPPGLNQHPTSRKQTTGSTRCSRNGFGQWELWTAWYLLRHPWQHRSKAHASLPTKEPQQLRYLEQRAHDSDYWMFNQTLNRRRCCPRHPHRHQNHHRHNIITIIMTIIAVIIVIMTSMRLPILCLQEVY